MRDSPPSRHSRSTVRQKMFRAAGFGIRADLWFSGLHQSLRGAGRCRPVWQGGPGDFQLLDSRLGPPAAPLKYIGFGGSGNQVRDCLHPRDLAPLIVAQAQSPGSSEAQCDQSGGRAGKTAMSLARLSDWCRARFGEHTVMPDLTPRPYDIPWMVLDSSQARSIWRLETG